MSDDQDLADLARVLQGDRNAFEGIVGRWQRRLVDLAWRFCRDRSLAEDMAQDAFLKAFRSLASFRRESSFSTWLTAIALNTYRSRLRAEGAPLSSLEATDELQTAPGALRSVLVRERDELVRRAVLALPARYRDAIVVFYFHEQDLAQSAAVLGLAEGTLKAQLHRGRELLRSRCAAYFAVPSEG